MSFVRSQGFADLAVIQVPEAQRKMQNDNEEFRFSSRKHLRTQPATRDPSTRNDVFNNP